MPARLVVSYLESVSSHFYGSVSAPEPREAAPGGVGAPRSERAAAPAAASPNLSFLTPIFAAINTQRLNNAQRAQIQRAPAAPAPVVHVVNNINNSSSSSSSQSHSSAPSAPAKKSSKSKEEAQKIAQEKEERRNTIAARAGAITVFVGTALLALSGRAHSKDQELLQQSRTLRSQLKSLPANVELRNLVHFRAVDSTTLTQLSFTATKTQKLVSVIDTVITVLESKCAKSRDIKLLTGAAVATGIAGFLGGMFSMRWLVTASIVSGVAVIAGGIYMAVDYWTEISAIPAEFKNKFDKVLNDFRVLAGKSDAKEASA